MIPKKKSQSKVTKYAEKKENENTIYPNLWDPVKALLRGKFMAVNKYIKKKEISQMKKHEFTHQRTRKIGTNWTQKDRNSDRKKEIIKFKAGINRIREKKKD